ncbi:3',5'-cyclic-AMP phosphodiesterase [Isoalcanivorax beigongshangi]|uniref:3',5'-cyclic-AMP phosphodiesterase n=1 Tax=Isoalcanivorax beigongshangi TaxID=3238810 RepID=A0ABV4AH26_9GAMM
MIPPTPAPPLRVVQLTDCHLFADPGTRLLGVDTQYSLEMVLARVRREQPDCQLVLATGDLSQDGSERSYRRLIDMMAALPMPVYWLEGNHDISAPLVAALDGDCSRLSPCVTELGDWTFVLLDSSVPDEVPGDLSGADMAFLEQALSAARTAHVMVCLHHHPVPMGSAWLDAQQIADPQGFFALLRRFPAVRAVVWGHVHQAFEGERDGIKLYSTPSTCVQFKPGSADFALDDCGPGYRWFDLHADGAIDSGVSRVDDIDFAPDLTVTGY